MTIQSCKKNKYGRYVTKGQLTILCLPGVEPPKEYYKTSIITDDQENYTEVVVAGDCLDPTSRRATCCYVGMTVGCFSFSRSRKDVHVSWYKSQLTKPIAINWADHLSKLIDKGRLDEAITFCIQKGFKYDHY